MNFKDICKVVEIISSKECLDYIRETSFKDFHGDLFHIEEMNTYNDCIDFTIRYGNYRCGVGNDYSIIYRQLYEDDINEIVRRFNKNKAEMEARIEHETKNRNLYIRE